MYFNNYHQLPSTNFVYFNKQILYQSIQSNLSVNQYQSNLCKTMCDQLLTTDQTILFAQDLPNKVKTGDDYEEYVSRINSVGIYQWTKILHTIECKTASEYYNQWPRYYLRWSTCIQKYDTESTFKALQEIQTDLSKHLIYITFSTWANSQNSEEFAENRINHDLVSTDHFQQMQKNNPQLDIYNFVAKNISKLIITEDELFLSTTSSVLKIQYVIYYGLNTVRDIFVKYFGDNVTFDDTHVCINLSLIPKFK